MTDQDNLRDRIADLIEGLDDQQMIYDGKIASPDDIAQAIIDDLGLTVERSVVSHEVHDDGTWTTWPSQTRIVGKWEPECHR